MHYQEKIPDRYLRLPEESSDAVPLYEDVPPRFPSSVKIGITAIGFSEESVNRWMEERKIESGLLH
jgi:hypothetical protein